MKKKISNPKFLETQSLFGSRARYRSRAKILIFLCLTSLSTQFAVANPKEKAASEKSTESLQNTPPLSLQAKHGGELQPGKSLALEFKQEGELIQFFPQQADGRGIETKDFKISGLIKMKRGKPQKLIFAERDGYYFASLDFGDAAQLSLEVRVEHSGNQERFHLVAKNPKSSNH